MRHDKLIVTLYNELLSKNQRLLIIYTGKTSGHRKRFVREESGQRQPHPPAPALEPTTAEDLYTRFDNENITGIVWIRDQFLLYYSDFHLLDDLRNESMVFDKVTATDCSVRELNVSMTVTKSNDSFKFEMTEEKGYWWMANATWNDKKLSLSKEIFAPHNFSYHCTPSIELFTVNRTVVISWTNLQLQPNFNSTVGKPLMAFRNATWDCVYFFSPGILSGLFVVSMFMTILFIAISCILDINANDRFDSTQLKFVESE